MDWDSEKECFESFSREMSEFYAVKKSLFVCSRTDSDQVSGFSLILLFFWLRKMIRCLC